MRAATCLALAAAAVLAGCGHRAPADPGGLSPEDSQMLNNAASMLDNDASTPGP